MFSNFVYFEEVVKLSTNIFHTLAEMNYSSKLMSILLEQPNVDYAKQIFEFEEAERIIPFSNLLISCKPEEEESWIHCIFNAIKNKMITNKYNHLETLLEFSIKWNCLDVVKYLCEAGVNIHFITDLPIRHAAAYGLVEIIKCLLDYGADLHSYNEYCLHIAVKNNHFEAVKCLIENGAKLHIFINDYYFWNNKYDKKITQYIKSKMRSCF